MIISLLIAATAVLADCPTPTVAYSWQPGLGVQYAFPAKNTPPCWAANSISGLGIDGDINSAFNQWSYADQAQNSSNNGFYYSTSGPFEVFAQTVVDQNDCGLSVGAQTTMAVYTSTNILAFAQNTFYFGSTSPLGFANYDPGADNYHEFIQKVMAHEIGHIMGLTDQPYDPNNPNCGGQTAGESVMNAACGTNDQANNMPAPARGLPDCDNASVQQSRRRRARFSRSSPNSDSKRNAGDHGKQNTICACRGLFDWLECGSVFLTKQCSTIRPADRSRARLSPTQATGFMPYIPQLYKFVYIHFCADASYSFCAYASIRRKWENSRHPVVCSLGRNFAPRAR